MLRSPSPRKSVMLNFDSPLSTRKARCTPSRLNFSASRVARTAPAIVRYSSRRFCAQRPTRISFKHPEFNGCPMSSPCYDSKKNASYFEQCFVTETMLGSGSFGEVYGVYSKEDGKRYAVKCAIETFRNNSDRLLKIREVEKHEMLNPHPNLLRFHRAWEEKGRLYMQTELCKTNLSSFCEGKTSTEVVWNCFMDLLSALDHLHSSNLIHLDIKPDNVLLTEENVCKLGDFGLMFDLMRDQLNTAEEGDSKYLAPEVLNSAPTKAADIFSLGITILQVATGIHLPSQGSEWHELRGGDIPERYLRGIPSEMRRLILWMLSPNPVERPTTTQLVKDESVGTRMSERKMQLRMINVKSSTLNCMHVVWLWFAAFCSLLKTWGAMLLEALKREKNEVCRRSSLFAGDLSESPEKMEYDLDITQNADWSFNNYDLQPDFEERQTKSAYPIRHRYGLSPYSQARQRSRCLFDDDTRSSSDDQSCSPENSVSDQMELRTSPEIPAGDYVVHNCDWSPTRDLFGSNFDEDELDNERCRLYKCYRVVPERVPLRERVRFGKVRPIPRINWNLLDSPSQSSECLDLDDSSKQPPRKSIRQKSRRICDSTSSAEE
ncbi:unnamed protein product [Auanema sp. JU1783]|nr:unnamed protein product [Auanema sp. JU1783]